MTWVVLIATITVAELQAAMLASMAAAGLPTSSWTKDGFYQNFVNWIAFLLQAVYAIIRDIGMNSFLDTASGQGLTDLAEGGFGTPRRTETFATGSIVLENNSGLPLDEVAEAISFALVADPSITYKNSTAAYALNGNQVTVPIVCDVAGTVGNAAAGTSPSNTIELVTVLTGVTVVSNTVTVGQDEQADEPLRVLASKQASVLGTSVGNKYEWIALNTNTDGTIAEVDDGKTRTNVNRVLVSFEDAQGRVFVTLASPSGPVDAGEYTTTIGALEQYALTNPGILVDTNASAVPVDISATIELQRGSSTSGVSDAIDAYLLAWFVSIDNTIGSDDNLLTLDELRLIIGRTQTNIKKVTFTAINGGAPADVAISDSEVATAGTFAWTITVQP